MVRRVRDGRFGERPHYKPEELDDECESVIVGFLRKTHGDQLLAAVKEYVNGKS